MAIINLPPSGLRRSRLFEGNATEAHTLEQMLHELRARKGALVICDAGIATADNVAWLIQKGYRYLVVSREPQRQFDAEQASAFESAGGETIRVHKVLSDDRLEVRLYCHSSGREKKEVAIAQRFIERFETGLVTERIEGGSLSIVLAAYNGAKYLPELLASLDAQSAQEWRLIARDDGSRDESLRILNDYIDNRERGGEVVGEKGNLGVIRNFSLLLERSREDYVMLADQDDVWYPNKIAISLAAIRKLESDSGRSDLPALVFTDLHVVDSALTLINRSFVRSQGLKELVNPRPSYRQLLTQNAAPGCSMIVNRALLELALPVPRTAALHDWWLIQVAALFGKVGYIDEPTLAYRQHDANRIGAIPFSLGSVIVDLLRSGRQYRETIVRAQIQVSELLHRYGGLMTQEQVEVVEAFATLSEHSPLLRQWIAYRHGLSKAGLARNIGFYLLM